MWMLQAFVLVAQSPRVPEKLRFADMELHIDAKARAEIQKDVDRLHQHPGYFQSLLDRVNLYFPTIERVLNEERVPEELKYLVIQESALVSDAVSVSNAVGFWQFKMASGQEVGLRIDKIVDERMHIEAATRGAARYLLRNNSRFDNWLYALMAYNVGPGGALSLVDKDLYGAKSMQVNAKTHWYVKKFLAHQVAFQGLTGHSGHPEMQLHFFTTSTGGRLDELSKEFAIAPDLLRDYNKWLKTSQVPSDKPYRIVLPIAYDNSIALARLGNGVPPTTVAQMAPSNQRPEYTTRFVLLNRLEAVVARPGDTQKSLAQFAGISRWKLRRFNDLLAREPLRSNQAYYLEKKRRKAQEEYHVLQPGETLWDVAQAYGLRLNRLLKLNRLAPTQAVKPGRQLHLRKRIGRNDSPVFKPISPNPERSSSIRSAEALATSNEQDKAGNPNGHSQHSENSFTAEPIRPSGMEPFEYKVQKGDTYFGIAAKLGLAVDDILLWNGANAAEPLRVGQILQMYRPKPLTKYARESDHFYVVQPGDTLFGIAKKSGIKVEQLMELNGLKDNTIHPGQQLRIRP
jgi:membrane-bound lytic murein transglycosylase D